MEVGRQESKYRPAPRGFTYASGVAVIGIFRNQHHSPPRSNNYSLGRLFETPHFKYTIHSFLH